MSDTERGVQVRFGTLFGVLATLIAIRASGDADRIRRMLSAAGVLVGIILALGFTARIGSKCSQRRQWAGCRSEGRSARSATALCLRR